jgi:hypothetical protein
MMNSTNRAVDDRRSADVLLHMTRIDGGEDADIHGSRVFSPCAKLACPQSNSD